MVHFSDIHHSRLFCSVIVNLFTFSSYFASMPPKSKRAASVEGDLPTAKKPKYVIFSFGTYMQTLIRLNPFVRNGSSSPQVMLSSDESTSSTVEATAPTPESDSQSTSQPVPVSTPPNTGTNNHAITLAPRVCLYISCCL